INGEIVPPLVSNEGRASEAPRSSRVSSLVMILNGRPEETSMIGATVNPLMKWAHALLPLFEAPVLNTALVTQRWRWSFTEFPRSRLANRLSCGSRVDCRSVPLSIECDQV